MRFPLALTVKIARHIIKHKMRRTRRFALVLQLEPLHTCNLTCTGCGRIREYSTSLKDMMSLEDCLGSAQECGAPMVSICGGEPLIYPKIEELVAGLLKQGRIVYVCTNGMFMRKKLSEHLAATYSPALEPTLARLLTEKLISQKDADTIRKGKTDGRPTIGPTWGCRSVCGADRLPPGQISIEFWIIRCRGRSVRTFPRRLRRTASRIGP